jgi:hypothetical protein
MTSCSIKLVSLISVLPTPQVVQTRLLGRGLNRGVLYTRLPLDEIENRQQTADSRIQVDPMIRSDRFG